MGSGGGKWQRLRLLRAGRHPKDSHWIGAPVPEAAWSMATVSSVNTALLEERRRGLILEKKAASQTPATKASSRLAMVRQRVLLKERAASGRLDSVENCSGPSSHGSCAGMSVSSLSRFEALRQRIKAKEIGTMGEPHIPG